MAPRQSQAARRDYDDEEGPRGALSAADMNTAAAHVVRLALFHEYRRAPLRRDQVTKLVLPNAPRQFPDVMARAQNMLRTSFGMELYELRAKYKGDAATQAQATQATQPQAQTQRKKRRMLGYADEEEEEEEDEEGEATPSATQRAKKVAGTRSYVLRSVLSPQLIAAMNNPVPLPYFEEDRGDRNVVADSENDDGALLRWDKADATVTGSIALLGVRTIILCLILANGRVIEERALYAYLRRLNLERHTVLPWKGGDSHASNITMEQFMDALAKQSYLEKTKHKHTGGDGPTEEVEWRAGARAEAEFSEEAACTFIQKLYLGDSDEESESEDEAPQAGPSRHNDENYLTPAQRKATRRDNRRKRIRVDLERAAGGKLTGQL